MTGTAPLSAMKRETKSFSTSIESVDELAGTFEAIVSVFGNVDLGGDRVMPGAFAKTLDEWTAKGDPMPVIWSHDWDNPESHVGWVVKAEERPEGLWVLGQFDVDNPDSARPRQVARLLKQRRITQFSFGYMTRDWRMVTESDGKQVRELLDLDVFEVGPTLLGMNPATQLLGAASRFYDKAAASEVSEGVMVEVGDRSGRIEYVMTEGTFGLPDSAYSIEASADDPAVLVRIYDDGVETEFLIGARASTVRLAGDEPAGDDDEDTETEPDMASKSGIETVATSDDDTTTEQSEAVSRDGDDKLNNNSEVLMLLARTRHKE